MENQRKVSLLDQTISETKYLPSGVTATKVRTIKKKQIKKNKNKSQHQKLFPKEKREGESLSGPSLNSSWVGQGVAVLLIIITVCKLVCKSLRVLGLLANANGVHAHLLKGQLCTFQTENLRKLWLE